MVEQNKITGVVAKTVLQESFDTGVSPEEIVSKKNLLQIESDETISGVVKEVIADNPEAVKDYQEGKEQALSFLIGQIMRKTKGKANPNTVKSKLQEYLNK
jgi:aspartyl-tRNA(Asn)/glutamyl-tRNA(Gln) amidotransferase subunit B